MLLDREHFADGEDLARPEQAFDFFLIVRELFLHVEVDPGIIRGQRVVSLFVLDPCIVHEGLFEKLLELTGEFHDLGLRAGVVHGEGYLETSLTLTLPAVLSVLPVLHMVKWTEPSKSNELLACWRLNFLVDWRQEALDFGTLVANDEASEAVVVDVVLGHVQFVDQLSSMGSESRFRLW